MKKETNYPPLTAYKVFLDDGTDYVTSMGAEVTLKMAQDYFVGNFINQNNDETLEIEKRSKCIKVERVN